MAIETSRSWQPSICQHCGARFPRRARFLHAADSLRRCGQQPLVSMSRTATRPEQKWQPIWLPRILLVLFELLAPQVGLEPTTLRLTAECSAIELLRSVLAMNC